MSPRYISGLRLRHEPESKEVRISGLKDMYFSWAGIFSLTVRIVCLFTLILLFFYFSFFISIFLVTLFNRYSSHLCTLLLIYFLNNVKLNLCFNPSHRCFFCCSKLILLFSSYFSLKSPIMSSTFSLLTSHFFVILFSH